MKYLIVIGLIILTIATVYPMTIETFADVDPLRSDENGEGEEVEAFISSVSTKDDSVFAMQGVSWCPQCARELPTFRELRRSQNGKKFGGKNLRVVQQDCEGEGKKMCEMEGVRKYPTYVLHHEGRKQGQNGGLKGDAFNRFLMSNVQEDKPRLAEGFSNE